MGEQRVAFIRLLEIRGHLGQQLVGGHADVDGEAQLVPDALPDPVGHLQGLPEEMDGLGHVEENLIDAEFLMIRGVGLQKLHHPVGALDIVVKAGGYHGQLRTFAQGLSQGFAGGDPVLLGEGGLGQHDAVAALGIAAHGRGDGAQVQGLRVRVQPVHGLPAEKCRVYINMKDQTCIFQGLFHQIASEFIQYPYHNRMYVRIQEEKLKEVRRRSRSRL